MTPSPYGAIPRAQRPPDRRGTGRKRVAPGVKAAIAARGLAGEAQWVLAREFDVSRDLVKRCVEQARTMDPEATLVLRRAMPERFLVAAFAANERAIEAIQANDAPAGTRWQFQAKLATEANRLVDKVGGGGGTTMLELIRALNDAGGGSVTVAIAPDGAPDAHA